MMPDIDGYEVCRTSASGMKTLIADDDFANRVIKQAILKS